MTGIYLRVMRAEGWVAVEVEHLDAEELARALEEKEREELVRWVLTLARWIGDHVEETG